MSSRPQSAPDSLSSILNRFVTTKVLFERLTLAKVHSFIVHAARLRNDILLTQPAAVSLDDIPAFLPTSIQAFLCELIDIPIELVPDCWTALKDLVWDARYVNALVESIDVGFMRHGLQPPAATQWGLHISRSHLRFRPLVQSGSEHGTLPLPVPRAIPGISSCCTGDVGGVINGNWGARRFVKKRKNLQVPAGRSGLSFSHCKV